MLERSKRVQTALFGGDFNFGLPGELSGSTALLAPDFVCATKDVGPTLNSRYTEYHPTLTNIPSFVLGKVGIGISLKADHMFVDRKTAKRSKIKTQILKDRVSDHSPVEMILDS